MALTDTAIRNAKPGDKPRKLSDDDWLFLVVNPNGSKLWRMGYRFAGKESVMSLGAYPALTLKDARELRNKARGFLREGKNPNQQKKLERVTQALTNANTFDMISAELPAKKEREAPADAAPTKTRGLLSFATPRFAEQEVIEAIQPLHDRVTQLEAENAALRARL